MVRSPVWSVGLGLAAAPGLLVIAWAALRPPQGIPFKLPPVIIMLGLVAVLIVKNIVLFSR